MLLLLLLLRLCLCLAAAKTLPRPYNVVMDAVNNLYVLKWDWNNTQTNYSMKFTVEYSYSEAERFSRVCYRVAEKQCNITHLNLPYCGSYVLRVRAEGRGEYSPWKRCEFTPDVDASLGPPAAVEVKPGDAMLMVFIAEPVTAHNVSMSSFGKLIFTMQYWQSHTPEQKISKQVESNLPLTLSLNPRMQYCLHVMAFLKGFNKSSPFTPVQCLYTLGHSRRWPYLLPALLCLMPGLVCFCWKYEKIRSFFKDYGLPSSIAGLPVCRMPPMDLVDERCSILAVEELVTPTSVATQEPDCSGDDSGVRFT